MIITIALANGIQLDISEKPEEAVLKIIEKSPEDLDKNDLVMAMETLLNDNELVKKINRVIGMMDGVKVEDGDLGKALTKTFQAAEIAYNKAEADLPAPGNPGYDIYKELTDLAWADRETVFYIRQMLTIS